MEIPMRTQSLIGMTIGEGGGGGTIIPIKDC